MLNRRRQCAAICALRRRLLPVAHGFTNIGGLMPRALNQSAGILEVIGQVYDAAQNDALWDSVVLAIARASGSAGAALLNLDEDDVSVIARTPNVDNAWLHLYQAYFRRLMGRTRRGEFTDAQASRPQR